MMEFAQAIEYLSMILGVYAIYLPIQCCFKLHGKTFLGNRIAEMFAGEAFGMSITLLFALLGFSGILSELAGWVQSTMRCLMFVVAIITSKRLMARAEAISSEQ